MDDRYFVAPSMTWIKRKQRKKRKKETSRGGTWEYFYNVRADLIPVRIYDYDFRVKINHGLNLKWGAF